MKPLLVIAALLGATGLAEAYPQFQLTTGAQRCNQCHYAPAGTGLISGYGRDEAGDTISIGGDGAFLHGAWDPPKWLALGGDIRVVGPLAQDVGQESGVDLYIFAMQLDLYQRIAFKGFSLNLIEGYVGRAYDQDRTDLANFASREHYLMYQPKPQGWYARAGRFFMPFGLRLVEHIFHVRRHNDLDLLQETYNVSGGFVKNEHELHVTAFTEDFLRPVGDVGSGVAAYYERRVGRKMSFGGQARLSLGETSTRITVGGIGKVYLEGPRLLFQAELDGIHESFEGEGYPSRQKTISYLGATWFPMKGVMVTGAWERFDEDLSISEVARNAAVAEAQFFPWAHFEVILMMRAQFGGEDPAQMLMLQVHYYL